MWAWASLQGLRKQSCGLLGLLGLVRACRVAFQTIQKQKLPQPTLWMGHMQTKETRPLGRCSRGRACCQEGSPGLLLDCGHAPCCH